MYWLKISCILCLFGCFKDFRPSEPFVTDYLTGPWKNFTDEEVNQEIYPVSTYSYATTLILIFLITDFVRYKPIIILCGLSGVITFFMMIYGKSMLIIQIMEFFYGLFMSAEVAYYTYIYAKVDKKHYQEVTSHTKAASLFGRSMSGVVAQLTASFDLLNYHQLNYITASAFIIATIWSLFLPSVGQSIYFHHNDISDNENSIAEHEKEKIAQSQCCSSRSYCCCCTKSSCNDINSSMHSLVRKIVRAYALLWKHFTQAYTNYCVIKWSLWWALATCGFLQVTSYMQILWRDAVQPTDRIYNGAVDFIYAILGAVTVFCVGKIRLNWALIGDITLSVCSFLEGIILLASSYNYNIWFLYVGYILFCVIYHTMVTVASFEVAKYISEDSYSLIFGVNIFFALVAQSLLTLIVINAFMLNIRWQFFTYGGYYIVLAIIYIMIGIINLVQHYRSGKSFHLYVDEDNKSSSGTPNSLSNVTLSESENNI